MNVKRLVMATFPVYVRINDKGATSSDGGAAPKIADTVMDENLRKYGHQKVGRKFDLIPEDFQLIQITMHFSDQGSWNEPVVLQSGVDYHSCIVDYTWVKRSSTMGARLVDYFTYSQKRLHIYNNQVVAFRLDNFQRNLWVHNPFEAYWQYREKWRLKQIPWEVSKG
jgi:hypothetical protein